MKLPSQKPLDEGTYQKLLAQAGKALGTSAKELESKLNRGKIEQALAGLSPAQKKLFSQLAENPALAQKMLQTPKAQAMMKQYLK